MKCYFYHHPVNPTVGKIEFPPDKFDPDMNPPDKGQRILSRDDETYEVGRFCWDLEKISLKTKCDVFLLKVEK